jgi:hypothetical protein
MTLPINQIATTGDSRRKVLDVMDRLMDGTMDVSRGEAVVACLEAITKNMQAEVNVAKMVLTSNAAGHSFGRMVGMGQRIIGNDKDGLA